MSDRVDHWSRFLLIVSGLTAGAMFCFLLGWTVSNLSSFLVSLLSIRG